MINLFRIIDNNSNLKINKSNQNYIKIIMILEIIKITIRK